MGDLTSVFDSLVIFFTISGRLREISRF